MAAPGMAQGTLGRRQKRLDPVQLLARELAQLCTRSLPVDTAQPITCTCRTEGPEGSDSAFSGLACLEGLSPGQRSLSSSPVVPPCPASLLPPAQGFMRPELPAGRWVCPAPAPGPPCTHLGSLMVRPPVPHSSQESVQHASQIAPPSKPSKGTNLTPTQSQSWQGLGVAASFLPSPASLGLN